MTHHYAILEKISNEGLAEDLRNGDLSAFERLNLSFDKLYASKQDENELGLPCNVTTLCCPNSGTDG